MDAGSVASRMVLQADQSGRVKSQKHFKALFCPQVDIILNVVETSTPLVSVRNDDDARFDLWMFDAKDRRSRAQGGF